MQDLRDTETANQHSEDQCLKYTIKARTPTGRGGEKMQSAGRVPRQVHGTKSTLKSWFECLSLAFCRIDTPVLFAPAIREKRMWKSRTRRDGPLSLRAQFHVPFLPSCALSVGQKTRRHLHTTLQECLIICTEQKH